MPFHSLMMLPDVQSRKPRFNFKLTRVGIKGVKKQIRIKRPKRLVTLVVMMDLFVDLPAFRKGSDLSRNAEVIEEIVDESAREPSPSLEALCAKMAESLLERHEYATNSEVLAKADYFLERNSPSKKMMEPYKLMARARMNRNGSKSKMIGVEVIGMTACPCAMEMVSKSYGIEMPTITHNQRNISSLMMESRDARVEADDLIQIVEDAMSSPTYELLKREDEREVVMKAHKNPKFVEDVVRDILKEVLEKYPNLPDDVMVIARSESLESIHKHNAFAERETTMGKLRK